MPKTELIYFDHAATSLPKPAVVIDAVREALLTAGNAGRGVTAPSLVAANYLYDCRVRLAKLFHAKHPERMILTSNITESLNMAIRGSLKPGDHVLTDASQHNSVLRPLGYMSDLGVDVEILPVDAKGRVTPADYAAHLKPNTKAIVCQHASNLTGNVFDLAGFSKLAEKHNILLIVDAAQSAGLLTIDLQKTPVDLFCFTGHKSLLGPQGTGGLYVRPGVDLDVFKAGGTGVDSYNLRQPDMYPEHLEAGTLNSHGFAGLAAALGYLEETGCDKLYREAMALSDRFLEGLREIPGAVIYGDVDAPVRMPIVTFNLAGIDAGEVADYLGHRYNIACRTGAHCAPLLHRALGTADTGAVRFSFAATNTEAEIDLALKALRELS